MSRGDGTGLMGQGPMTGRGFGYCSGNAQPGFVGSGFRMGKGFARCMGSGFSCFGRGFDLMGASIYNDPQAEKKYIAKSA